ncbi:MAG: nicotinate phosphoribosyltransferase [Lachnospirales bacterium]
MNYNNLTLLTDLYELTMMQGYFYSNNKDKNAVFDLFFRKTPDHNGFAITAGLQQAVEYLVNLEFSPDDIQYLDSLNIFTEEFLNYLRSFKFKGDVYAIPEGTVVFPHEPLMQIHGTLMECQLVESALLNIINHQSLIATKSSRVVSSAGENAVLEFGLRRAQGPDAAIYGSRAAIIGGCKSTSNVLAGKMFDIPVSGTHAHSWIMGFDTEYEAFKRYSEVYKERCYLLVDTYNTLKSGVPNAIRVFTEMKKNNRLPKAYGIRLDSGDLAYLSIKSRELLDKAGFTDAIISASSDLDEYLIMDLKNQGAKIDVWGVGTNLITSKDNPSFGGVYKISAEINGDTVIPKIKLSENSAKVTNPGIKKIFRLYDREENKVKGDLITLVHETINTNEDLTIFHPIETWRRMTLKAGQFTTKELLIKVMEKGELIYNFPSVLEIAKHAKEELGLLWSQHRRLTNPQTMPVDLSQELYDLKVKMITEIRGE